GDKNDAAPKQEQAAKPPKADKPRGDKPKPDRPKAENRPKPEGEGGVKPRRSHHRGGRNRRKDGGEGGAPKAEA
ncbi:MAG: hypothetical protein IJQ98_00250, partial [Oscillospiraceae bacterium]|nr:hypothetical protein [Oscillospiraceae bacterium]